MKNLEKILLEISFDVGSFIKRNAFKQLKIDEKKRNDFVTEIDKKAELMIKDRFKSYQNMNFLGEEYGFEDNKSSITVIIDPIDGTKSYMFREFDTSTSIAIEENGEIKYSAVYDFMRDILYLGTPKGIKFYVDKSEIKIPIAPISEKYRICLDFNLKKFSKAFNRENQNYKVKKQRGSLALSMAQTALGIWDGFIFTNIDPDFKENYWDFAGGHHLLSISENYGVYRENGLPILDYKECGEGVVMCLKKDLKNEIFEVIN